jgi:hypothetical protein
MLFFLFLFFDSNAAFCFCFGCRYGHGNGVCMEVPRSRWTKSKLAVSDT